MMIKLGTVIKKMPKWIYCATEFLLLGNSNWILCTRPGDKRQLTTARSSNVRSELYSIIPGRARPLRRQGMVQTVGRLWNAFFTISGNHSGLH